LKSRFHKKRVFLIQARIGKSWRDVRAFDLRAQARAFSVYLQSFRIVRRTVEALDLAAVLKERFSVPEFQEGTR
jgi:hypothetical protein